jgi:hypothetical protein
LSEHFLQNPLQYIIFLDALDFVDSVNYVCSMIKQGYGCVAGLHLRQQQLLAVAYPTTNHTGAQRSKTYTTTTPTNPARELIAISRTLGEQLFIYV